MNGNDNYTQYSSQQQNNNANATRSISNINGYDRNSDGSSTLYGFYSPPQQDFNTDEMRGSMQQILSNNIGEYVLVEFLIGTQQMTRKQGILSVSYTHLTLPTIYSV